MSGSFEMCSIADIIPQLEQITRNMYRESNLDDLKSKKVNRQHFVTCADICRIQKMIEEETIRLASSDGASVLKWVSNLREQGHFMFLKQSDEPLPLDSDLEPESFVLIMQRKYQRKCWEKYVVAVCWHQWHT
jgi:hypothetical protein